MKYILYIMLTAVGIYFAIVFGKIVAAAYLSSAPEIQREVEVLGSGEEIKYIAAGDSLAFGTGASGPENTLAYKIAELLGTNKKVIYRNIAEEGAKTEDIITDQLEEMVSFDPDVILITVGGNDAMHLRQPEDVTANYKTIISTLEERTEGKIYISNIPNFKEADIFPIWYREIIDERYLDTNAEILKLENERVKIIDAYTTWDDVKDSDSVFAIDNLHPNDYGYDFWVKAFSAKMGLDADER